MSPSAVSAQEQVVPVQDMAALQFGAQIAGPAIVNPEEAAPAPVATNLPGQSLYVGELHPDVTEANLFELFSTVGPVASIRVCRDAVTRRSLGYAYVNFHSPFDAERALDTFNYTPIKGRVCRIMWSQRDPSLRKSGVGNIYIKNLDKDIDNKTLHDTFSMFGNILSCKVVQVDGADAPGYGFVHFETAEAAQSAIDNVNGKLIKDKKVFVTHHVSRREREVKAEQQRARFTNIYVKPLGEDATEAELEQMFSGFGEISSLKVAINNETRKCRGFGFVNFKNTEAAQNAVNELNGKEVNGAVMMVTRAQKKAEREQELRRKFEQARQERLSKFTGANLYIKNLEDDFDDERLRQEFSAYGTITSAKVMRDDKGNPRGFGFVCFSSSEEATRAVTEMNGRIIGSKPLYIAMAQRKDARRAQLEMQHAQRVQLRMQQQMAGVPNPMMYGPPMFFPPAGGMPGQGPRMFPPQMRQPRWNGPMPVPPPQGQMPPAPPQGMPQPMPGMQPFGRFPAPVMPPQYPMNGVPMQQMNRQVRQNNRGFRNGMTGNQQGGRPLPNGAPANGAPHRRFKYGNNARNVPEGADGALADTLTAAALANMSIEQQKRTLGERLFPLVQAIDAERASKIVGMLLEIENTEVLRLIESPEELSAKVAEAIDVLAKAA